MSISEQQQIIIYGASVEELLSVKEFIQRDRIRFGEQNGEFELREKPSRLILPDNKGIYLQKGQPWEYPFAVFNGAETVRRSSFTFHVDHLIGLGARKWSRKWTEAAT